ncbi:beta-lactamase [Actinoplanes sp. SE50]|uniref:serine hydrolase domain-containing protein n=1 Tax=unclassified Actinoplanes TaxID=2626549 RepID=UPI00023EC6A8|nr:MULTISPECIES: serine hydrolase domain-containing protein [unclassified Actinoplanes]AEV86449.1 6-aminohexanoate-dimer hydrolase [Actinoplanes sp. SE50/110]ATO84847.1 beta-lactamase [Actinoplanes sp. SE50]SLM02256.1 serine hydrolase [Actinoplanes sp. SE50/110]
MNDDLLADFVRVDRERRLGTYGIHVYREGHEPLTHRFRSDDRVNLYSVSKTFTSVAAGLAEADGRFRLDDLFLDHFPELRGIAADGFERVTVRHLITMTSGSTHKWFASERIDAADLLHEFLAAPLDAEPGERFSYTGSGPYAVGRLIARTTGADVRAYLLPRLFRPLDLHNPAWHTCPLGFPFAESDLFLKTGELARFARLLLQEGVWEGRQIIPAEYVRRMPAETVDTTAMAQRAAQFGHGYGLGVWLSGDGTYRMDGAYGQYALIDPERRVTVTATAHSEGEHEEDLFEALAELLKRVAG